MINLLMWYISNLTYTKFDNTIIKWNPTLLFC